MVTGPEWPAPGVAGDHPEAQSRELFDMEPNN